MKKLLLSIMALLAVATSVGLAQSPPCPDPSFNVEAFCLPAPGWTAKREVIQLGPHCFAEVEYCVQWVCTGYAGYSRSRISISRFRVWSDDGSDQPPLCPTGSGIPDQSSGPTVWQTQYEAYIKALIHQFIIQGIALHTGPLQPCSPSNTDYLTEVLTTTCVTMGGWEGQVDYGDAVWHDASGITFNYCSGESKCIRKYHTCLENGVPKTTMISSDAIGDCDDDYEPYPTDGSITISPKGGDLAIGSPGNISVKNLDWWVWQYECVAACWDH